ncbi:MAG: lamin tail domain-containing protein [Patescibacteria group bacterium]|nr:lamin tail domain-containing protein [Patescibacteria group bacterium]
MKYTKYCIVVALILFTRVPLAFAGFEITEIMYDLDGTDTNREWVEVKNTGSTEDDLSKWYLFSDNTKHSLTPEGESMVQAGGYAVIAQNPTKFKVDWPNFSGMLFDSSWTGFNNESETIALKDPDLNIVSSVNFTSSMGGAGNGNSLQNIGGSWVDATPTPGLENVIVTSSGGGTISGGSSTTVVNSTITSYAKPKEIEAPRIIANIIVKNIISSGVSFPVNAVVTGYNKELLKYGKFIWNFGDGSTKEEKELKPFDYTYSYPGEYVLTLSYYQNYFNITPDATDRLIIKVIPSGVSISSVGSAIDPYVEIENKSSIELDLSKWYIQGAVNKFYIPTGTILLPNKKLKFSPKVTLFNDQDINSVSLYSPTGEVFANYPLPTVAPNIVNYTPKSDIVVKSVSNTKANIPEVINLDNLEASASTIPSTNGMSNTMLAWAGFLGVIVTSSVVVLLLQKKNRPLNDDLDIKAEDMKIIE